VKNKTVIAAKAAVWAVGLAPALRLVYRGVWTTLGANPVEFITLSTGTWSLVFLMATLAITPLRRWAGLNWLIRIRRLAGLFSFFYGCIHFITYVWLDKFFDLRDMAKDIVRRPFITMGFIALSLMIPLAATSSTAAIRRLGGKWQSLHRLVYVSAAAAVVHFWWKVKADIREPAIYAGILATLLITRLWSRKAANIKKTCQKWAKLS
jgi:methionine sulfoxide reductase heme-binding subunit